MQVDQMHAGANIVNQNDINTKKLKNKTNLYLSSTFIIVKR